MSHHAYRPSDPSTSPSPGVQGARTLANFLVQRGPSAYRESAGSHESASRPPRSAQMYEQKSTQPPSDYPNNYPKEAPSGNSSRNPSLSLDTRNLVPPSGGTPSPTSTPGTLHADLNMLKAGLEALWARSSHTLHTLHSSLIAEREARKGVLRERDMLAMARARLWEDKAQLESERRELRAKLDAQAAVVDVRERVSGSKTANGDVKVKMEETDDEDSATVPMREVQRMIEERLRIQASDFARETTALYAKLAAAQTRAADLEAYLTRPGPSSLRTSPSGGQAPPRSHPRPPSPVTPYTGQPSTHSEREFPFVRRRPDSATVSGDTDSRMYDSTVPGADTTYNGHGGTPLQDSRAYAALRAHGPPSRTQPAPRDAYLRRLHSNSYSHPHEVAMPRTVSLPSAPPMLESPRRTLSGPAAPATSSQGAPPPLPPHQAPYHTRHSHSQPFRHHPLSQPQQQPLSNPRQPLPPPMQQSLSQPTQPLLHPRQSVPPSTQQSLPPTTQQRLPTPTQHLPQPTRHHLQQPTQQHVPQPTQHVPQPMQQHLPQPTQHHLPQPTQGQLPQPTQNHLPPPAPNHLPQSTQQHLPPIQHPVLPPQPPPPRRPSPPVPPPIEPPPPSHPAPPRRESHPPPPLPPTPPTAPPQPTPPREHSRPSTPVSRPTKRARTADVSPGGTHEMTDDERRTLGALNSVLTKKRDGAGWKCVLCRQEKKSPTATFSETTPIGLVTDHVRGVHAVFWETLGGTPDVS